MEDEENATIRAAHKKYRGLGKDDLLKAIYRLRTLNVYFKNLRKGKNNPEKLKQSDIVRQIRALTKKYGKEILGLGISITDAANIFPGMQRIVDAAKPLIEGGRAIPVHQSLPSSGSIARSLSTGYDSVLSQALSERSLESMGLYGVSLWTKINLKKRSDLPGEINSDTKNMCSNKQNATLKQKIMIQDNKKMWF